MHLPSRTSARRSFAAALAAAVLALGALPAAIAAEAPLKVEGQAIAPTASVAGTELRLNGAGTRAWTVYKMYVAALYLPKKASTVADIVGQPGPKRMQLRILMSVGGASGYLADAFTGGIRKRVTPEQFNAMKDRVDAFDKLVRSLETKKGDLINLDYLPDAGLTLSLNGKTMGKPVPGDDLYDAMLKIWVGDDAKDKPLRAALLGGPPN
jgi:hypothetical protein